MVGQYRPKPVVNDNHAVPGLKEIFVAEKSILTEKCRTPLGQKKR